MLLGIKARAEEAVREGQKEVREGGMGIGGRRWGEMALLSPPPYEEGGERRAISPPPYEGGGWGEVSRARAGVGLKGAGFPGHSLPRTQWHAPKDMRLIGDALARPLRVALDLDRAPGIRRLDRRQREGQRVQVVPPARLRL